MSLAAMHWARQSLKTVPDSIKAPARLALMLLADYADEQHASWPSISTMALEMGCSVRSVQRSIDLLASHGLLQVETRHATNGRQMSNRYHLAIAGLFEVGRQSDTPSMSDQPGEGDNLTPSESDKLTVEGVTDDGGRVSPVSPLEPTSRTLPLTPSHSGATKRESIFDRAVGLTDSGEPLSDPAAQPTSEPLLRKTGMTLDWEPDVETWQRACYERGLPFDADVHLALIDFREYFATQPGRTLTATDWTRRFARWVTENRQRQTNPRGDRHVDLYRRKRPPTRRLTATEARARDRERQQAEQQGGRVYEATRVDG